MVATTILQVWVDAELKKRVDARLKRMGFDMSTAVNMLMHQIDMQGKIPFEIIDKPNSLQQSIEDIEAGVGLSRVYDTPEELYKDLGI